MEDKDGLWDIADGLILRVMNQHTPVVGSSIQAVELEPEPEPLLDCLSKLSLASEDPYDL